MRGRAGHLHRRLIGAAALAALAFAVTAAPAAAQSEPLILSANGLDKRIDIFKLDGTPAGTIGGPGSGPGQFNGLSGLGVGPGGTVAAVDSGNGEVDLFDASNNFIRSVGAPGSGPGLLNNPADAAFSGDGQLVYVADFGDNQIEVFRVANGASVGQIGVPGAGDGQLQGPVRVELGPDGNLYVGEDANNDRIQAFNSATGAFVRRFGGPGSGPGQFDDVSGLAFTAAGDRLFAADRGNNRIQVFNPADGSHQYSFGQFGFSPGFLSQPFGVAVVEGVTASARSLRQAGPEGLAVVADKGNSRIDLFDLAGSFRRAIAVNGVDEVAVLTPLRPVDLSVTKRDEEDESSRASRAVGEVVTLEISISNSGAEALNVVVEDLLSDVLGFAKPGQVDDFGERLGPNDIVRGSVVGPGGESVPVTCIIEGSKLKCTIPRLAQGQPVATIRVAVVGKAADRRIENRATVKSSSPDSNPGNNTSEPFTLNITQTPDVVEMTLFEDATGLDVEAAVFPRRDPATEPGASLEAIFKSLASPAQAVKRLSKLARVEVAILRRSGKRCQWLRSTRVKFKRVKPQSKKCNRGIWLRAKGTKRARFKLKRALPPGKYTAYARAVNKGGVRETTFSRRDGNMVDFTVRRRRG